MTVTIRTGDCIAIMREMPAGSVHTCVTSPPYFGLRDYGHEGQIGLEETPDAYVAKMVDVFREVRRVLRDDGTVWLNLGDSYAATTKGSGGVGKGTLNCGPEHNAISTDRQKLGTTRRFEMVGGLKPKDLIGIPWRVAFALQADGWWLRQDIIWAKPNPMPESVTDRCTKAHEYLFLLSKRSRYYFDAAAIAEPAERAGESPGGNRKVDASRHDAARDMRQPVAETRNKRSVWTVATQPYSGAHFATFPPDLIDPCIKAGCPLQCCNSCGAPYNPSWTRGADAIAVDASELDRYGTGDAGVHSKIGDAYQKWLDENPKRLLGMEPSCSCGTGTAAGTVLDPFGGAGTAALVADRLGRNAILCELNPAYADMARDRVAHDAGLFFEAAE